MTASAVDDRLPRYGVVGHPVAHSLSPEIHRAFAEAAGIALDYGRVEAPLDGFVAVADRFFADGGRGLNVTVPFKLDAFARCDGRVSERASLAGAVNTLRCVDGVVDGDNTDGIGLAADLARLLSMAGRSLAGTNVLLIGAGGSARGVVAPLFDAGVERMTIVARDGAKARALAVACAPRRIDVARFDTLGNEAFDLVINATSASLAGASLPIAPRTYASAALAYDLMYGAEPTRFMIDARAGGAATVVDGLGMLVEQAAESFLVWHGVRPATGPVRDALRAKLDAR